MLLVRLREAALEDLKSIGRYTQQTWGQEQRNIYLSSLNHTFKLLAREPELGRSCDEIRPGYRKHSVSKHVVFYRLNDGCLEIVRILHGHMDVERHLPDE